MTHGASLIGGKLTASSGVADGPGEKVFRIDLSPQGPIDGFTKAVFDLKVFPWPLEDSSVDEARCMDYLQKLDGDEQIGFMNELHRVLKQGRGCLIGTPYGNSNKAWQNPTNKRPIYGETFLYYNKGFREAHGLPLEQITADFDIQFPYQNLDDTLKTRHHDVQAWMSKHMCNAVHDLVTLVVKK